MGSCSPFTHVPDDLQFRGEGPNWSALVAEGLERILHLHAMLTHAEFISFVLWKSESVSRSTSYASARLTVVHGARRLLSDSRPWKPWGVGTHGESPAATLAIRPSYAE